MTIIKNYGIETNYSWTKAEVVATVKRSLQVETLDELTPKAKSLVDEYIRVRTTESSSSNLYEYCSTLLAIAKQYQQDYEDALYISEHWEAVSAANKRKADRDFQAYMIKLEREKNIQRLNLSAEAIYA